MRLLAAVAASLLLAACGEDVELLAPPDAVARDAAPVEDIDDDDEDEAKSLARPGGEPAPRR